MQSGAENANRHFSVADQHHFKAKEVQKWEFPLFQFPLGYLSIEQYHLLDFLGWRYHNGAKAQKTMDFLKLPENLNFRAKK